MSKQFGLSEILTVTTGALLSRRGMEGVYDILNYMTGDNLYTHQLPRACDECKPWVLRQHPQLANLQTPTFDGSESVWRWLEAQEARFGASLPVEPIPADDHAQIDPITEAAMMVSADRVIIIEPNT